MPRPASAEPGLRSPSLARVMTLVWLCSLGTAVAWQGLFFVAENVHGFSVFENYYLAISGGGTYVVFALTAGRVIRALEGARRGLSPRSLLAGILVMLALACAVAGFVRAPWSLWTFVLVYAPLTGWLWPLVESYVASGRSGTDLVRATGRFNVAWASAIPVPLLAMGPLMPHGPLIAFQILAGIHLACLPLAMTLPRSPRDHGRPQVDDEVADVEKARALLHCFRLLNGGSYVLISWLLPAIPARMESLGITETLRTPMLATWTIVRIGLFVLLERWHGWHGRWRTTLWSGGGLILGFALAYLATSPEMMMLGLVLIGVGTGGAYTGAIYYAMDVGKAEVDAGGKHEAILGSGYLAGPIFGLLAETLRAASETSRS